MTGGKPALDPDNPDQRWLLDQLERMFNDGLLIETPWSHVRLPSDKEDALFFKGNTTYQPITLVQLLQHAETQGSFARHTVPNVCLLGGDLAGRRDAHQPLKALEGKDACVLDKADLWGLYQALSFMAAQAAGKPQDADPVLYILNKDGFYDPLITALAADHREPFFGACVVATPFDAVAAGLGSNSAGVSASALAQGPLQPHDLILFYSSGLHKFREYAQCFSAHRTPLNLQSFTALFPGVRSADEESCTYGGNIAEKIDFLRTRVALSVLLHTYKTLDAFLEDCPHLHRDAAWGDLFSHDFDRQMDAVRRIYAQPDLRAHCLTLERLEQFGRDNQLNIYGISVMLEDAGLEVDADLTLPASVAARVEQANPHKPWPGAELAHFITSMPWDSIAQGMQQSYNAIGRDPVITNRSTIGIVPLVKLVLGSDLPNVLDSTLLVQAAVRQKIDLHPGRSITNSEDFLVPLEGNPEGLLAADIPHYAQELGPRAAVTRALMMACALSPNAQKINYVFDRVSRVGRIATQYSLMDDCNGHGDRGAQKCIAGPTRTFISGQNMRHRFTEAARTHGNPLMAISHLIADADAFILMPPPKRDDDRSRLVSMAFEQAVRVAKQIDDPAIKGKPAFMLVRPGTDPDPVNHAKRQILDPLENAGLRGMKPHQFIPAVVGPKNIRRRLNGASRIKPIDAGSAPRQRVERGAHLETPDSLYCVTLYGSASWQGREDIHREKELSFTLAALGFGMKSGGGNVAVMGAFNDGYEHYRALAANLWGENLPHDLHNASIQCHQTAIKEGLFESPDRTVIYTDIREREWDLMQSDATLMRIGGDGTLEECANDWLMRDLGLIDSDAPFIVDHRLLTDGTRLFQGLDEYLSPAFYQNHGVFFNSDDVATILHLVRDRDQHGKGIDLSYIETVLPNVPHNHLLHAVWAELSREPASTPSPIASAVAPVA